MPSARDHARALRQRARTWFSPTEAPSEVRPPERTGPPAESVIAWATRDLLRAESSEDVARIVANAIDVLGGSVVPADVAGDDALPLDVSFGMSGPMLPTAPTGTPAHDLLVRHLPALVADARQANDNIIRTVHLTKDVATDPVTGLETRATFTRELARLRDDDAVVVMRVTVPAPPAGEDDQLEDAVREFAGYLMAQRGANDHAARVEEDEFGLLLRQTGTAGTSVVVARLKKAWAAARPDVDLHVGVGLYRDSGVATLRHAYEDLDRQLDVVGPVVGDASDEVAGSAP